MKFGTMTVTGWYYIIGVLIAAPFFGKKLVDFDFSSLPAIGVAEIAYILILGTMLPNYLLYYGTEKLTSVHTGLYSYLQPVAATVLGIYRNQVTVGYDNIVAAALIFVGIILVMITYARSAATARTERRQIAPSLEMRIRRPFFNAVQVLPEQVRIPIFVSGIIRVPIPFL